MNTVEQKKEAFERLLTIMDELREKCPWDMKQTLESLRHLSIEEVYELGDAILDGDMDEVKKELGDVFLHLVFYSRIASETEAFDIADVLNSICEKLISRHPHIYGDTVVKDEAEVLSNWEKLKLKEGKKSVLEGVPRSLPAMVKAQRIQDKAKGVGFDWDNADQVWEKVLEELNEFKDAKTKEDQEEEFGDLLFSLVNYARFEGINPENALEKVNMKFTKRFEYVESKAGEKLTSLSLDEMNILWAEAKMQ